MTPAAALLVSTAAVALSSGTVAPSTAPAGVLPTIVITGRADSQIGVADSASQGNVGQAQLEDRPVLRPGEVLETVPGVIITQHSGPGKANQYFLRGFNLDHGTDFATSLDGMPLNLPSHAHGQGYTDLNFIMPELVDTIQYEKGLYDARQGDFATAGSADIRYVDALPAPILTLEGGSYLYARALLAGSTTYGRGNLLYAGEFEHEDGPWVHPDNYFKGNGLLRYSSGDFSEGLSLTAFAYHGVWDATDQIPDRAVDEGLISRFGSLDTSDGGVSDRYGLQGEWHRDEGGVRDKVSAFAYYYDLDLFSDFTYFLFDPVHGDQIEQQDDRVVAGAQASRQWDHRLFGLAMTDTVGVEVRNDAIWNGLYHTEDRVRLSTTRDDDIEEASGAPYYENRIRWTPWLRSVEGLRVDVFNFRDESDLPGYSGEKSAAQASPKASLIFGPWDKTEYYVDAGFGYHSNDARGLFGPSPVTPLSQAKGAEVGARTTYVPGLQSTLAFWLLDLQSELVYDADDGSVEPSGPTRRIGVEWSNYYKVSRWLSLDADLSWDRARYTDDEAAGSFIPEALETMASAGVEVHDLDGWFGEARVRYFGPRPLTQDGSVMSNSSTLVNLRAGRKLGDSLTLAFDVFNLLNAKVDDIEYYYATRLPGEPAQGVNDIVFHPAEPLEARVSLTAKF